MDAKPQIKILATGGTIAGSAASETATTGYRAGALGIDALLNAVPEMKTYADVSGEQLAAIDSKDMTDDIWFRLAGRVNALLSRPGVDGIVITHGTDTMEETAYFLNLTVHSDKPVVLTGAMRPATAISADGPMNLLNAIRLAASPEAAGKGVLLTLNDTIEAARETSKTHTTAVDTFQSLTTGSVGAMGDGHVTFYREPSGCHTTASEFDLDDVTALPYVPIIYGHANMDTVFIDAAVKAGAKGIVYAGMGNGSIHKTAEAALAEASKNGIIVVRSTHAAKGAVIPAEPSYAEAHFIDSHLLNPQKARILLQLALTKTSDPAAIQAMFLKY